jgi:inner membrane protein
LHLSGWIHRKIYWPTGALHIPFYLLYLFHWQCRWRPITGTGRIISGSPRFILFFTAQVFIHDTLDAFNSYGVGWFEPFSHERISFNALFVADPFFSIAPGLAAAALFILKNKNHRHRKYWVRGGLIIPVLYLVYALFNKVTIDKNVRAALSEQKISYTDYFTTPTPLNNWLWYVVAKNDSGYNIGYRSVFDTKTRN